MQNRENLTWWVEILTKDEALPSPWLKFLLRRWDCHILYGLAHDGFFSPTFKWIVPRKSHGHVRSFSHGQKSLSHIVKGGRKEHLTSIKLMRAAHIILPLCPYKRVFRWAASECFLNISYKDHLIKKRGFAIFFDVYCNWIQASVGVHDDLLTMMKMRKSQVAFQLAC